MTFLEIFGYAASALIAVSLMMKNIVKLRWINLFGASSFATYGFFVGAYPVLILNSFIALVDIFYLITMYNKKTYFSVLVAIENSNFLKQFISFYKQELTRFFPNFDFDDLHKKKVYYVLRDLLPVGLFIYEELGDGKIEIHVDFAIPNYRDLNNAKFLYKAGKNFFVDNGYNTILATSENELHKKYLEKIGFVRTHQENEFVLKMK